MMPADILRRKQAHPDAPPLVCLTAYTAPMAQILDPHCDLLLVGDSVAMVLYGMDGTRGADLEMMIRHGKAVARQCQNACVIVDMPYGSYEECAAQALESAKRVMDETGAQGVKVEGGAEILPQIEALVQNEIPVLGHLGLLPQSVTTPDGFKVQGREESAAAQMVKDSQLLVKAGVFAMVLEAIPPSLAQKITQAVSVPTIGIGASAVCDGQILVTEDMLGFSHFRTPKFVKKYNSLQAVIKASIEDYAREVRGRQFPSEDHTYAERQG